MAYLFNDGRRDDIRSASLREAAQSVASAVPAGPERERAAKAAAALKSEWRGRGAAKQFFWAPTP